MPEQESDWLLNIARAIFLDNVVHFVFVRVRAFEKVTRDSGVSRFFRRRRYPPSARRRQRNSGSGRVPVEFSGNDEEEWPDARARRSNAMR